MKRKKRRIKKQKVSLFHVIFVGCCAFLLAVTFILLPKISQRVGADTAGYYVPIPITPNPSAGTMQLQTVKFQFIAYTPTPTPPPDTPVPQTNSCGSPTQRLVWLNSAAAAQYNGNEWPAWVGSSCSGNSMAMVFNTYGKQLKTGDVLETELRLGAWNPNSGILGDFGFALTGNAYGFNTDLSHSRSLDQIIAIANGGKPVIVGAPMHILVLTGGDSQYVYLADPSIHNYKRLTRNQFANGGFDGFPSYWTGLSVIMTPKQCF